MKNITRKIKLAKSIDARISLPGSKSITHRAIMMASLASDTSQIRNPLDAEDTRITVRALEQLGAGIEWRGDLISVIPAKRRWLSPDEAILLGNSGTSARLLLPLASAGIGKFMLDGTARLRERPLGPVAQALETLGTRFAWLGKPGFPPVEVYGTGFSGGEVSVDASESGQFLSGLLMAAPAARSDMQVTWREPVASFPYVAMTLVMMERAGIRLERPVSNSVFIPAPQEYRPVDTTVEGDCSSASYFWGAAAVTGGTVFTSPVSSNSLQGDCRFLDVLERMGCRIEWECDGVRVTGPERLSPIDIDMNSMPDMVPTLAVVAAFAQGSTRIGNVAHLRIKESDRIESVAAGLEALGIRADQLPDGLKIHGGNPRPPTRPISSFDDHRIAMAFAIAGLRLTGVEIEGADSVAKSFPEFWDYFDRISAEA